MIKVYTYSNLIDVNNCGECPNHEMGDNSKRVKCSCAGMDYKVIDMCPSIPTWCPLPNKSEES